MSSQNKEDSQETPRPDVELEKLVDSKYAGYLISDRINEVLKSKLNFFKAAGGMLLLLLGLFEVRIWYKLSEIETLEKNFDNELVSLKKERDSINNQLVLNTELINGKLDFQDKKLDVQDKYIGLQEKNINQQDKNIENIDRYYNLYYQLFHSQLAEVVKLRDETSGNILKYVGLKDSIENKVNEYRFKYVELRSLQDSLTKKMEDIERETILNKTNAAIRYVYAERSDRYKGEIMSKIDLAFDEYKPSSIVLPGTKDTLTFIFFHASQKGRIVKTVDIDVYRNNKRISTRPIQIEENRGVFTPRHIDIPVSDKLVYQVEPVFIYLPPNIAGAVIIPDFVVLKVSIKDKIDYE